MAKRRGPYQIYLKDYRAEIPRTTKYRWKVKDRAELQDNSQDHISRPTASHREVTDDVNRRSSSSPRLLDSALQQNTSHDDDINTDGHMTYTSTNGEEDLKNSSSEDELDSENSSTTSLLDMDIQEGIEDQVDGDKPLYPGAPVSKGESLLMLMSYVLRNNLTGEVWVIGSKFPIVAAPGDDVILPCHLEPIFDVRGLTVEWSQPDLKPDPSDRLSRVEYVHLYRDRREVLDMKLASYFRRTQLFIDDLKHGNISLKILNVSEEDSGRYRCFIPKLPSRAKAAIVQLIVDPNITKTLTTETLQHPRNLQTPDPHDMTETNAGRSRVSVVIVVVAFISVVSVAALAAYFSHRLYLKLTKHEEDETQKQPLPV